MRHLAKARGDLLGANRHRFVLNPPLSQAQVLAFEKRYAIAQPDDSRHFVRHIGNGLQSELRGFPELSYGLCSSHMAGRLRRGGWTLVA
jgi:hypothetical protein